MTKGWVKRCWTLAEERFPLLNRKIWTMFLNQIPRYFLEKLESEFLGSPSCAMGKVCHTMSSLHLKFPFIQPQRAAFAKHGSSSCYYLFTPLYLATVPLTCPWFLHSCLILFFLLLLAGSGGAHSWWAALGVRRGVCISQWGAVLPLQGSLGPAFGYQDLGADQVSGVLSSQQCWPLEELCQHGLNLVPAVVLWFPICSSSTEVPMLETVERTTSRKECKWEMCSKPIEDKSHFIY